MKDERITITDELAKNAAGVLGDQAPVWLAELPVIVAACERRWSIEMEAQVDNISYNYVAFARRGDGTAVVLKVCLPTPDTIAEVETLRRFDGQGCVRLLEYDPELRAYLMERLEPGAELARVQDDVAGTSIAADVMRRLWRPAPLEHALPLAVEWLADARSRDAIPLTKEAYPWIRDALAAANELASEAHTQLLLHGDLHHDNILSSHRDGWLAIDPHGVIGEAAWEIAPFLLNNLPPDESTWAAVMRRRAAQLCDELSLDRQRVYIWTAVRALQSAFWSLRDDTLLHGKVWAGAVLCAEEFFQDA